MITLSVLVPSVHSRWDTFGISIQKQLWAQLDALPAKDRQRVEIIVLTDNKTRMLGDKRNIMIDMAQGEYVAHVDDDDRLEPDYLSSLLDATATSPDVVTFNVSVTINGSTPKICRYSSKFKADKNLPNSYERLPNHIMCVRKDLACRVAFPSILKGEDSAYSKELIRFLKTEVAIDRVLYHYDYSDATTVTQQYVQSQPKKVPPPTADIVFLSKATTPALRFMTQRAIDTAVNGAKPLSVNCVVIEQAPGVLYQRATTIYHDAPFQFNGFLNKGARLCQADWIVFSNNDVVYKPGWLHALLEASHPVVSPKEPRDARMVGLTHNEIGIKIGRHLAGWCFMMRRDIYDTIGGLDEDFDGWCSDDAVIEQLKPLDIQPMVVAKAVVAHIGSKTLNDSDDYDELTWGGIEKFEKKYGKHKLSSHPDYKKWLRNRA